MGMKRYSAPPVLSPHTGQQTAASIEVPYLSSSSSSPSSSSSYADGAHPMVLSRHHQQQQHPHHKQHPHPHHQRSNLHHHHHTKQKAQQQEQQHQQQQQPQQQPHHKSHQPRVHPNQYRHHYHEQEEQQQQQPQQPQQYQRKHAQLIQLNKHNHQHQPHHQHHHHHHRSRHDSSPDTRPVKTEQTFESLFEQETHSDVSIRVNADEYVFHAHRAVLEAKSKLFAALLARHDNKPDIEVTVSARAVLHVQEDAECGQVFSRFLYFLYSGTVWLHQEYVLPLFRLAHKYGVSSLLDHCQAYILQVLAKSCHSPASPGHRSLHHQHHHDHHHHDHNDVHPNAISHNHSPTDMLLLSPNNNSPPYVGNGFSLDTVCDLYEDDVYEGHVQQTSYRLLCCQFQRLVRTERWLSCSVGTVCSLISGDNCNVEENLILVSATDFMKRKNLSDKKQIEDILSLIRYPRLNRRVLYHLQKNGSFKNFPRIQKLMLNAMMYHSFKDLPEAKDDFVGTQFRPRMSNNGSPNRRASMQVATVTDCYPDDPVISESAYSLDPASPVTLIRTRQSQV